MPRVPSWLANAMFYQVFPDRFARSSHCPAPTGPVFQPWGSKPTSLGFQGGDLLGLTEQLPYLLDLGINALYLNPIFTSASNHRYHTDDYFQVDPLLGGDQAFETLLSTCHRHGVRVILDGVFNHCGRGFWPFHHLLETGASSPYRDWFLVRDWPLRPYHATRTRPHNYEAWWNLPALPKLNLRHPPVRRHVFEAIRHWTEQGIDGWRLDVPEEIDVPGFWEEFHDLVLRINPEAYLVGEIWNLAPEWLAGDRFHGLMNYPFMVAVLGFCGGSSLREGYRREHLPLRDFSAEDLAVTLTAHLRHCPAEALPAQLNLLGSHDTARVRWILCGDAAAQALAFLLLATLPGAPCIYYGDELGLSGGDDPLCRGAFPWHAPDTWDQDTLGHYRSVLALRKASPALRMGALELVQASGKCLSFLRRHPEETVLVLVNAGDREYDFALPSPLQFPRATAKQLWPLGQGAPLTENIPQVVVSAKSALILAW